LSVGGNFPRCFKSLFKHLNLLSKSRTGETKSIIFWDLK
jgi:hypothetical protein